MGGLFEVKVFLREFGIRPKLVEQIKYDVDESGIHLSLISLRNSLASFDLHVPFPCNITVAVPKNPAALYLEVAGILSCRIPIVDHELTLYHFNAHKQPELGVMGGKKKRYAKEKIDKRLHRNHKRLTQLHDEEALQDKTEKHKLSAFQKSLHGIKTTKSNKSALRAR